MHFKSMSLFKILNHRLAKLLLAVDICRCNFLSSFKGKSIRLQTHQEQSIAAAVINEQSLSLYFYYLL